MRCYYSFLFKGFFLCWRSATLTILDMKTHFDLDNFNGRPNETISTSNKAGSIKITMCFNVSMFLSQHGFALLQTVACGGVLKKTLTSAKVNKILILHICDFWNEKCLVPSLEACKC